MEWWDFISLMVGDKKYPANECGKCGISFLGDPKEAGMPHGIQIAYGTMYSNCWPILCERCYARFHILIAEWLAVKN